MAVHDISAFERFEDASTLCAALESGPLPLHLALHYAIGVAHTLDSLRAAGRTHGAVDASNISLRDGAAVLNRPKPGPPLDPHVDVAAFGALLSLLAAGRSPALAQLADRCRRATAAQSPEFRLVLLDLRMQVVLDRLHSDPPPAPPEVVADAAVETVEAAAPEPEPEAPPLDLAPDPSGKPCPKCGRNYVFLSHPRTFAERSLDRIGAHAYRCHGCEHRYSSFFR